VACPAPNALAKGLLQSVKLEERRRKCSFASSKRPASRTQRLSRPRTTVGGTQNRHAARSPRSSQVREELAQYSRSERRKPGDRRIEGAQRAQHAAQREEPLPADPVGCGTACVEPASQGTLARCSSSAASGYLPGRSKSSSSPATDGPQAAAQMDRGYRAKFIVDSRDVALHGPVDGEIVARSLSKPKPRRLHLQPSAADFIAACKQPGRPSVLPVRALRQ